MYSRFDRVPMSSCAHEFGLIRHRIIGSAGEADAYGGQDRSGRTFVIFESDRHA